MGYANGKFATVSWCCWELRGFCGLWSGIECERPTLMSILCQVCILYLGSQWWLWRWWWLFYVCEFLAVICTYSSLYSSTIWCYYRNFGNFCSDQSEDQVFLRKIKQVKKIASVTHDWKMKKLPMYHDWGLIGHVCSYPSFISFIGWWLCLWELFALVWQYKLGMGKDSLPLMFVDS